MHNSDDNYTAPIFDAKPEETEYSTDSFAQAMQGIEPLRQDKIKHTNSPIRKAKDKSYHREQATADISDVIDGLSTQSVNSVDSDQALNFACTGLQLKTINKLRKGHLPWEQGIDLHGLSVEQARSELSHFIRNSHHQNKHVVLVVHGKAYSQSGSIPVIKSYVNDWLRQLNEVLAFSSAQAKDGGTGALYVLLRRKER
jgi:DNA-nicking Smr family endonuclease